MKFVRQLILATAACAVAHVAPATAAGKWPERPVRIVVPWAAGGFTDVLGRLLAEKMTKSLGQTVLVENRPGASGTIGARQVAMAEPDGYTLLLNTSDSTVKMLQDKAPDVAKDFTPITLIGTQPVVLSVGSHVPVATIGDFVARAKSMPGRITYGSSGEGSAVHLAMEMLTNEAGIQLNHVPYKGMGPAIADLLAGQIDSVLISFQGSAGNFKTGKMKPLAVSSMKRSSVDPSVPTIAESGYPDFELLLWYALVGPKGLPAPVVETLNREIKAALQQPDLRERLTSAGTEPIGSSPAELGTFVNEQVARWGKVIK